MMTVPTNAPRLTLRDDLRDADGQPRPCLILAGRTAPIAFSSITAALAALRKMEAPDAGR